MQEIQSNPNLVISIKQYLLEQYNPIADDPTKTMMMNTHEVFSALQAIYPSDSYNAANVAEWLHAGGFKFYDIGGLRLQWLLQPI